MLVFAMQFSRGEAGKPPAEPTRRAKLRSTQPMLEAVGVGEGAQKALPQNGTEDGRPELAFEMRETLLRGALSTSGSMHEDRRASKCANWESPSRHDANDRDPTGTVTP